MNCSTPRFLWAVPTLLAFALAAPLPAQDPLFEFIAEDATVPFNPENGVAAFDLELSIVEDLASPTFPTPTSSGFVMIFQVDPGLLTVTSVEPTGPLELVCGEPWEFVSVEQDPPGCPGATAVGVLYGLLCDVFPTFEEETPMLEVELETVPAALAGATQPVVTSFEWIASCNSQLTGIIVGGLPVAPDFSPGVITLEPVGPVPFVRGDCNIDGDVNIADPIHLLQVLFLAGILGPCIESCDVDGSGDFFDLADALLLLGFLFQGGAPPAPPFPDCGTDPAALPADCEAFSACP